MKRTEIASRKHHFYIVTAVSFLLVIGLFLRGDAMGGKIRERVKERVKEQITGQNSGEDKIAAEVAGYKVIEGDSTYGAGDYRRNLNFGGRDRFYLVHVPSGYNKDKATPLVLDFHGGGGNPIQQRNDSEMDNVSNANGFIVVYPAGTGEGEYKNLSWNSGIGDNYANQQNIDDVGFTKVLLDDVVKFFHVDSKRIYATGFSNGGFMSHRVGCALSNRIAAIAPVSGVMGISFSQCKPSRPVPVIHFHGKEDTFVPYNGGSGKGTLKDANLPSVSETINYWIKHNECPSEPSETSQKGEAVYQRYGPGKDGSEVILWTLNDGGHTWPGGESTLPVFMAGKINRDISASRLIWEFFQKHPMP